MRLAPVYGAVLGLAALGCGKAEGELGSLMLAVSTDMYVDKDLSRVDIIVQPERGPAQSTQVNLFPALEGQFLPGTFAVVQGKQSGEFVRVRLIARQADRVRVVREAALNIPKRRTALLSMPIQWLCDGQVRQEGQIHRSDCDEGYTCIGGTCQLDEVDETTLPDYAIEDVFGGGDATGGGECFDMQGCFEGSIEPELDLDTCVLDAPASPDLNVAVLLPRDSDGHCADTGCWIPLDAAPLTGWSAAGAGVQLPAAVCERVRAGTARVRTSDACASKSPATPTCGPWTLVGTHPAGGGATIDTTPPGGTPANPLLAQELDTLSRELVQRVAAACAHIAGASPPADAEVADASDLCEQARSAVLPTAPLTWYRLSPLCWADADAQLACEQSCASGCDPGSVAERCAAGALAGICAGTCDSRLCLGKGSLTIACAGACDGTCAGTCEGSCLGQCAGECAAPAADGQCDGPCAGTCTGLCQGRCEGTCQGNCEGDPMLPPSACDPGALCVGSCSGERTLPVCGGALGPSPCAPGSGCLNDCQALGRIRLQCDRAAAWVLPEAGLDGALSASLSDAVPELVGVRDYSSDPVLEEATLLLGRLTGAGGAAPEALASVQASVSRLEALRAAASAVLEALGPARLGPNPQNASFECGVTRALGGTPGIDDFEDGDAQILRNEGRDGIWHVGHDGTGEVSLQEPPVPEPGGANGSARAMHLSGSGFTQWGASLNFELRTGAQPYDASVYSAVRFWARGTGRLRVVFVQQNLSPGHPCSTCDTGSGECGLNYGTEVSLSDAWSEYVIDWSSLTAPGTLSTPFAPDQLMTIQFEGPAPDPVDFWIDDVAFQ